MASRKALATFQWDESWFRSCRSGGMQAWRGVESQSQVSTWRRVDTRDEHEALEAMLDESKPPLPPGCEGQHYLLFTPFRYTSPYASRFRRANEAGIWYGAASIETVCAELAYWRHRFILDSAALARDTSGLLTHHTLFRTPVQGRELKLTTAPWNAGRAQWAHGSDYASTQALAAAARLHGVQWIRYESVRHAGSHGAAVLSPQALHAGPPQDFQPWICRATRERVILSRTEGSSAAYSWDF